MPVSRQSNRSPDTLVRFTICEIPSPEPADVEPAERVNSYDWEPSLAQWVVSPHCDPRGSFGWLSRLSSFQSFGLVIVLAVLHNIRDSKASTA